MSRLFDLVQKYRDSHGGASEASVARASGIEPNTMNAWWRRGRTNPPTADQLRGLARGIKVEYETILDAVLHDYGYLPKEGSGHVAAPAKKRLKVVPDPPKGDDDSGYAGPDPDYGKVAADEPGVPSEGQQRRDGQDRDAEADGGADRQGGDPR